MSNAVTVTVEPAPKPEDTVTVSMPRSIAEAIQGMLTYSPTFEAINNLAGAFDREPYQYTGTPAYFLDEALRTAGVKHQDAFGHLQHFKQKARS